MTNEEGNSVIDVSVDIFVTTDIKHCEYFYIILYNLVDIFNDICDSNDVDVYRDECDAISLFLIGNSNVAIFTVAIISESYSKTRKLGAVFIHSLL